MKDKGKRIRVPRKSRVFLVAVLLLMAAITAGGTLAWLVDSSNQVKNNFIVPEVTTTIVEGFDRSTKSNVKIQNSVTPEKGIDVYIRVALVPTWETADGSVAPIPASLNDLNKTGFPGTDWFKSGDYYYYKNKVAPQAYTSILLQSATVNGSSAGAQAGYQMNLQVLAEAIQATEAAVTNAWPGVWNNLTH